jgi:hypothetical protein
MIERLEQMLKETGSEGGETGSGGGETGNGGGDAKNGAEVERLLRCAVVIIFGVVHWSKLYLRVVVAIPGVLRIVPRGCGSDSRGSQKCT